MSNMNSTQQSSRGGARRPSLTKAAAVALAFVAFASGQQAAMADARTQAKRMYDRLTGTTPAPDLLTTLAGQVGGGTPTELVNTAIFIMDKNAAHSNGFYNVTLKNFATPWTNRDQTVFAPLNDYTATVIGMVRDNADFRGVLSDDIVYIGNGTSPAYSTTSNAHYEELENTNAPLRTALIPTTQSSLNGLPPNATAGIITSRAAAEAFFIAGTNRAMFRFTLLNHLCRDMEQMHDTSRPPDRIRQDVSRSPGGDSRIFLNNCIGCHSGMDPIAQAFAFYDFDETQSRLVYTGGTPNAKYFINADNFKPGFITPDDRWENYWRKGPNQLLGWDAGLTGSGSGAKSMGQELASSDAFARCQVEKVFKTVCFRAPVDAADRNAISTITGVFRGGGYRMKQIFAETAVYCMGT